MFLLGDGREHGHLLGDLYDKSFDIIDFTDKVRHHMLTPIRHNEVSMYVGCILALMGGGKTQLCYHMANMIEQHYGAENVQIIFTDSLEVSFKLIGSTEKMVNVIIIDDAVDYLASLNNKKIIEITKRFWKARHIYEDNSGRYTGKLFFFLNWQRFKTVHPSYRNPDLWAFGSSMSDKNDINEIETRIGGRAYEVLSDHWDKVQSGRSELKSDFVVRIAAKPVATGVGMYHGEYLPEKRPEWELPELIRHERFFAKASTKTLQEALDKIAADPDNERNLGWYLSEREGKTHASIATDCGMAQSTVWAGIASIKKLIAAEGVEVEPIKNRL